eukprot:CAMPEP_0201582756 /NCGR_PEP_ID=MMETSP0190_2-20130828/90361_1 /ASSEMBLY_ACC=CAM_ASM_000263 /TAXON_ID=37353 /ORGANISM="Rosalina sp." /LENGTH=58 /DNA_ID=CAMNT_0048023373 /DNA_START=73 /DNA_END=246 /DNA_ORIENTATION=-
MIKSYRKTLEDDEDDDHENMENGFGGYVLPFYEDDHLPTSPIVEGLGMNDIESGYSNY